MVNACTGAANLAGSLLVSFCHPPKTGSGLSAIPADRHVHGKFLSGLRQTALGLVRRRHSGLDLHSIYECEHGAVPFTDPADHAGTRLLRPQYAAVFHHTGGILTRRTAGGPGV